MERFIASILATFFGCVMDLKSSMERFIDSLNALLDNPHHYLKSSMERFIGCTIRTTSTCKTTFKIQYGEIYSIVLILLEQYILIFKIQYGEIYSIELIEQRLTL